MKSVSILYYSILHYLLKRIKLSTHNHNEFMDEQHANETLLQRTRKSQDFYPCCPFTFDPPNDDIDVIFGLIITGNYPMDVRVLVQPFYAPRSATNKEIPINLVRINNCMEFRKI